MGIQVVVLPFCMCVRLAGRILFLMTKPVTGFVCGPRLYEYGGWFFEFGPGGYWPLKNDGDLRKRAGAVFYAMLGEFIKLSDTEREEYRVGGGCRALPSGPR